MRPRILSLCKAHDAIKKSDLRQRGIDGEILPPKSKEEYYWLMRNFTAAVFDFFEEFYKFKEIRDTIEWGKQKGYDLQQVIYDLEECYAKYDDDEFIAAVDFMVLSKYHHLIEYAYLQIYKEAFNPNMYRRWR